MLEKIARRYGIRLLTSGYQIHLVERVDDIVDLVITGNDLAHGYIMPVG